MDEARRLQSILEAGSSDAALTAALAIIEKKRPDLLK